MTLRVRILAGTVFQITRQSFEIRERVQEPSPSKSGIAR